LARVSFNEISSAVTVGKIELGNPKKWNWKTLAASDFVIAAATGEIDTVIYDVPARK
jgi:hypothetical protein